MNIGINIYEFMRALSTIVPNKKQSICLSIIEKIHLSCYVHTMEYNRAVKIECRYRYF